GVAVEWDLARPGERRAARFTGVAERLPVRVHLVRGQLAEDAAGQDALYEDVALEDELVAGGRAERLEDVAGRVGPLRPRERPDDRLHVAETANRRPVAVRPVESERRSPVVQHERHVLRDPDRIEERIEIPPVLDEAIRPGPAGELVRIPHP